MKLEAKQTKAPIKKKEQPAESTRVEIEQKNCTNSKFVNQIAVLKDQNKCLEEKVQVN